MVFWGGYDLFFKSDITLSNKEKIEKLKSYSTGDMLTLPRNIEECPSEYDEEISNLFV